MPDLIPTLSDFLHSPPLAGTAGAEALFPMVVVVVVAGGWFVAAPFFCCCFWWLVSGPEFLSQSDPDSFSSTAQS